MFGGSAYYAAIAWASLGWPAGIVTRVSREDARQLREELADRGVQLVNHPCDETTLFENRYEGAELAKRTQRVAAIADPFEPAHVMNLEADVIHLGPLTSGEIPTSVIRAAVDSGATVSLDAQGDLRRVENEQVVKASIPDLDDRLDGLTVLKVDDGEAATLVGIEEPKLAAAALAGRGVSEVLVTFADRGALVYANGVDRDVPPRTPKIHVDATGCGDTFVASYVFERTVGASPIGAARFAAVAASLKVESYGPLVAAAEAVREELAALGRQSSPSAARAWTSR